MDPNETLAKLRAKAAKLTEAIEGGDAPDANSAYVYIEAYELAELVEALDSWMSSGGFSPKEWRAGGRR